MPFCLLYHVLLLKRYPCLCFCLSCTSAKRPSGGGMDRRSVRHGSVAQRIPGGKRCSFLLGSTFVAVGEDLGSPMAKKRVLALEQRKDYCGICTYWHFRLEVRGGPSIEILETHSDGLRRHFSLTIWSRGRSCAALNRISRDILGFRRVLRTSSLSPLLLQAR